MSALSVPPPTVNPARQALRAYTRECGFEMSVGLLAVLDAIVTQIEQCEYAVTEMMRLQEKIIELGAANS